MDIIAAKIGNPALGNEVAGLTGPALLSGLIQVIIGLAFAIGIVVFLFMLLLGGLAWITSEGDKNKVDGARQQITHALIGLILLFSVFATVTLIETIFKVNIMSFEIGVLNIRSEPYVPPPPPPPPPPELPTVTIAANPPTIGQGNNSTITWSSTNATSCSASGGWGGVQPTSGAFTVKPDTTTSYGILCTGPNGSTASSATVTVILPPPPCPAGT